MPAAPDDWMGTEVATATVMNKPAALGMRALSLALLLLACGGTEGSDPGPGSALHATDGGPAGAMDGKLGSSCEKNEDCETGICNSYPAKGGNLCSNSCDSSNAATQCPAPAVGCNKMGMCKF